MTDLADEAVLVDDDGRPIGTAPRVGVHGSLTPLHLAFSCYIVAPGGEILLTRRALSKRTWPGVWTNSCCGHPRPGEAIADALVRRVREELGVDVRDVQPALPSFRYSAVDDSGIMENEICPVQVARVDDHAVRPDPDEVMAHRWIDWPVLRQVARDTPWLLSPWAAAQVLQLDGWLVPE